MNSNANSSRSLEAPGTVQAILRNVGVETFEWVKTGDRAFCLRTDKELNGPTLNVIRATCPDLIIRFGVLAPGEPDKKEPTVTVQQSEMVNHPAHYNSGKIEVIEAIEDWKLNYHRGSVVKYTARAGKKDPAKEIEDLEKANWYLRREIENLNALKEGREPVRPNDMVSTEPVAFFKGQWVFVEFQENEKALAFLPDDHNRAAANFSLGDKSEIAIEGANFI